MIQRRKNFWVLVLCTFLIQSCGLRPVYDRCANNRVNLVELENIDSIEGAEFYSYLKTIMPRARNAKYLLSVNFTEQDGDFLITEKSDIVRQEMIYKIQYTLRNKSDDKIISSGEFYQSGSYNSSYSPFIIGAEQDSTREGIYKQAAREVRMRLINLFAKKIDE